VVSFYPNPANNKLKFNLPNEYNYQVEIVDLIGKCKVIFIQNIIGTIAINIENLINGFYSVNLTDNTVRVSVNKFLWLNNGLSI